VEITKKWWNYGWSCLCWKGENGTVVITFKTKYNSNIALNNTNGHKPHNRGSLESVDCSQSHNVRTTLLIRTSPCLVDWVNDWREPQNAYTNQTHKTNSNSNTTVTNTRSEVTWSTWTGIIGDMEHRQWIKHTKDNAYGTIAYGDQKRLNITFKPERWY
jgi:hypothetical protein